jgi:hypothetical protein
MYVYSTSTHAVPHSVFDINMLHLLCCRVARNYSRQISTQHSSVKPVTSRQLSKQLSKRLQVSADAFC